MEKPMDDEPVMDLNQSAEFVPSPMPPSPQVIHSFMPMPLAEAPFIPIAIEDDEEFKFMQILRQNLELFWHQQVMEILNFIDFKSQPHLPLARIKRIMKSDPEVKMISADTPVLFAKACEIFILELTLRAWLETEASGRRTLQRCDITKALRRCEVYDFLIDFARSDHQCDHHQCDEEGHVSQDQIELDPLRQNQEVPLQMMMRPNTTPADWNFNPSSQ